MSAVDADDLALLATGFEAALRDAAHDGAAARALFDLGWAELLDAAPAQAVATAFAARGSTGADAGILDDVVLHALGLAPATTTAVVLPAPGTSSPPGRRGSDTITIDGCASRRLDHASNAIVAVADTSGVELVSVEAAGLPVDTGPALDPARAHRRVRVDVPLAASSPVDGRGTWDAAIAGGRVALAHELVAVSRAMLAQAREHAVDRVQFGRAVATFQAVRHKLAESLVDIEGAAAVVDAVTDEPDPMLAALAKSLAGRAARTTATNAQQVLAGMGFTTDHPFHLALKRSLVLDSLLGSSTALPVEIGAALLREGRAPRLVEL